jgi:hypothetical protein
MKNPNKMDIIDIKNSPDVGENMSEKNIPRETRLEQNYPNPFNPTTSIWYTVAKPGQATLKVFDMSGKEVTTLTDSYHPVGIYRAKFNGRNLSSGVYVCRLQTVDAILSRKMILDK